ncbi:hypothetical protein [Pseudomonas aeruginosa]|uniref:hypothetical protein n=1 Tax=Pseudomonas aeruginosa TaxID=287 RepID=UPI00249DAD84|nr:hypothetical protein [Pseudomonas aeruginosa]WGY37364.1 hypothetical protein LGV63_32480 [Pseudomonas aeruginosa]
MPDDLVNFSKLKIFSSAGLTMNFSRLKFHLNAAEQRSARPPSRALSQLRSLRSPDRRRHRPERRRQNRLLLRCATDPKTILALLDQIDGLSEELSACTEHPGGCGYWREAAKRRTEERDQFKEENEALRESLQALIHISDATGWEDHTCGEIAKARAALEGAKP